MNQNRTPLNVLVCGGGIAGNAVALQLIRAGIRTTVVERSAGPRPGGQAVDLRGPSRKVAQRMGLMPGVRARQLDERGMSYVDGQGREFARMSMEMLDGKGPVADIEITRGDLNQVLLDQIDAAGGVDYRYGEWVGAVRQNDDGMDVTFASGANGRFDLVIGADGVHSALRGMVFGPEEQFATNLGGYMSFFTIPTPENIQQGWLSMHTVPNASVAIRADYDPSTSKAVITVRAPADPTLRRDVDAQRRLIREHLATARWEAPTVLDAMNSADDFYFDELARVDMPSLSKGSATLLGDAGYCGSPLTGQGTAMALVGAYVLAGEIAADPDDVAAALARYEEAVRPLLATAQEVPGGGVKFMLPKTSFGVRIGRVAMRVMTSRPMRPLLVKMMTDTDDYTLPSYTDPAVAP
ncbi:FAD-dependent monooxygenase [Antrihabitans cavernicola]|uniref:FAD-binding monooxygenase n=1 Tax=Antrihabitans cavernicola TaxID=2495913 RepID=A0A5A7SE65_9NOCA|nr:FAD-dependent monooxygenase [Spelaeibacter cavernicola]KAA0022987.1 FAD-binding monooxygenase [Spelaeibacter cavernicola]